MSKIENLSGQVIDAKDSVKDIPFIPASKFEELGTGKTYKAQIVAKNWSSITGSNGVSYQLVHCAIGGKGLVTILASKEDDVVMGTELLLTYTETVNGRARFQAIEA